MLIPVSFPPLLLMLFQLSKLEASYSWLSGPTVQIVLGMNLGS